MTKSLMRTTSAADMSFRSWFITNERCGEGGGGPLAAAAAAAAPPGAGGWWGQGEGRSRRHGSDITWGGGGAKRLHWSWCRVQQDVTLKCCRVWRYP